MNNKINDVTSLNNIVTMNRSTSDLSPIDNKNNSDKNHKKNSENNYNDINDLNFKENFSNILGKMNEMSILLDKLWQDVHAKQVFINDSYYQDRSKAIETLHQQAMDMFNDIQQANYNAKCAVNVDDKFLGIITNNNSVNNFNMSKDIDLPTNQIIDDVKNINYEVNNQKLEQKQLEEISSKLNTHINNLLFMHDANNTDGDLNIKNNKMIKSSHIFKNNQNDANYEDFYTDSSDSTDVLNMNFMDNDWNSYIDSLIATLGNGNVLLVAMMVMLALTNVDSKLIATQTQKMSANSSERDWLNSVLAAFQNLAGLIPYVDKSDPKNPKTITSLYDLFQIAYQTPSKDPSLKNQLDAFLGPIKQIDPQDWASMKWDGTDKDKLANIFTQMFQKTNQALDHIGSPEITSLDAITNPDGSIYDYSIDIKSDRLANLLSGLNKGIDKSNSISQQDSVLQQARMEAYQFHLNIASKLLDAFKQANQTIFR